MASRGRKAWGWMRPPPSGVAPQYPLEKAIALMPEDAHIQMGRGNALAALGLARARGAVIITMDGDLQDPPIDPASVDLAILSQALHHAAEPVKAIHAASMQNVPDPQSGSTSGVAG